jgi:hypothetical protein
MKYFLLTLWSLLFILTATGMDHADSTGNAVTSLPNKETAIDWFYTLDIYQGQFKIDSKGNIIICGNIKGQIDPGNGVLVPKDATDLTKSLIILKLNPSGKLIWVETVKSEFHSWLIQLEIDNEDNLLIMGENYYSTPILDSGTIIWSKNDKYGYIFYLYKIKSDGKIEWVKSWSNDCYRGNPIFTIDKESNIFISGNYNEMDFDPSEDQMILAAENKPSEGVMFLFKLLGSGEFQWVKTFEQKIEYSSAMCTQLNTGSESVYLTGDFNNTFDFNLGEEEEIVRPKGRSDVYLLELDKAGNFVNVQVWGGSEGDYIAGSSRDQKGNIYISGSFENTIDLDPGPGQDIHNSIIEKQYLVKFDKDCIYQWARDWSVDGKKYAYEKVAFDNEGNVYIIGSFSKTASFGTTGQPVLRQARPGVEHENYDNYLCRYSPEGEFLGVITFNNNLGIKSLEYNQKDNRFLLSGNCPENFQTDLTFETSDDKEMEGNNSWCLMRFNTAEFERIQIRQQEESKDLTFTELGINIDDTGLKHDELIEFNKHDLTNGWALTWGEEKHWHSNCVVVDSKDNIYLAGKYPNGNYLCKLDNQRELVWIRLNECNIARLAVDSNDNILVTGSFKGWVDFDPGPGVVERSAFSMGDYFVSKYNSDGEFLWNQTIEDYRGAYSPLGMAADADDNVYLTTSLQSPFYLNFPDGRREIETGTKWAGVVCKLNSDGEYQWVQTLDPADENGYIRSNDLAIVNDFGIYITGGYREKLDFDPGPSEYFVDWDMQSGAFLLNLDLDGSFKTVKTWGSGCSISANKCCVDKDGNIYVAGNFYETADFNPGPGEDTFTASTKGNSYISKFNKNCEYQWCVTWGGQEGLADTYDKFGVSSYTWPNDLVVSSDGSIYVTGCFSGCIDFDPGEGKAEILRVSNEKFEMGDNIFLSRFDKDGNFKWVKTWTSPYCNFGCVIASDSQNAVYMTSDFFGKVDIDPDEGIVIKKIINRGSLSFLIKINN